MHIRRARIILASRVQTYTHNNIILYSNIICAILSTSSEVKLNNNTTSVINSVFFSVLRSFDARTLE